MEIHGYQSEEQKHRLNAISKLVSLAPQGDETKIRYLGDIAKIQIEGTSRTLISMTFNFLKTKIR